LWKGMDFPNASLFFVMRLRWRAVWLDCCSELGGTTAKTLYMGV